MLPVLAWLIVDALPDTRVTHRRLGAIALQASIIVSFDAGNDSLQVKAPARWVWNVAPALYNPKPMIFGQRVGAVLPREKLRRAA